MQFGTSRRDPLMATGRTEVFELVKAWLATSLAFAILLRGPQLSDIQAGLIALLTAGIGFVLHELGHRVVARHYGAEARFQANDVMLVIGVLSAFAGFLFAAPGAVWHRGYLTKQQSGLVAAAGPIVNMVLAVIFLGAYFMGLRLGVAPLLGYLLFYGFRINAWLGFFNMLPLGPIDGAKILQWSMPVFLVLIAIGAGLAFGYDRIEPALFQLFGL